MKALFFDVDGTLVDIKTHRVPESAMIAVREARRNGNKIFIATGRSHTFLDLAGLPKDLIDGYVTLNGAVCLAEGKEIKLTKIPEGTVQALSEVCIREGFTCLFVTMDGMIVANPDNEFRTGFQEYFDLGPVPVTDFETMWDKDVYQMTVFFNDETEKELKPLFPELEFNRWFPTFADITCKGVNKSMGIEAMSRHFGIEMRDTIAFGDGGNDIPMLRKAETGVAMGNASEEVKSHADYITANVDDDGIFKALKALEII